VEVCVCGIWTLHAPTLATFCPCGNLSVHQILYEKGVIVYIGNVPDPGRSFLTQYSGTFRPEKSGCHEISGKTLELIVPLLDSSIWVGRKISIHRRFPCLSLIDCDGLSTNRWPRINEGFSISLNFHCSSFSCFPKDALFNSLQNCMKRNSCNEYLRNNIWSTLPCFK